MHWMPARSGTRRRNLVAASVPAESPESSFTRLLLGLASLHAQWHLGPQAALYLVAVLWGCQGGPPGLSPCLYIHSTAGGIEAQGAWR